MSVFPQAQMLGVWCRSARRRWPERSDSNICQKFGQWSMPRICSCWGGCSLRLCGRRIIWETGRPPCLWAWLTPALDRKNSNSVGEYKDIVRIKMLFVFLNGFLGDRLRRKEFHLPKALTPESIFQAELECLLKSDSQGHTSNDDEKSFTGKFK